MSRENILFSAVGLLLGYLIAFHLVFHINQSEPAGQVRQASAGAAGGGAIPTNDVKDRQRLLSAAESAAQVAREDPKSFDAQMRAGNAALEAGDSEGAIDFLTRAVCAACSAAVCRRCRSFTSFVGSVSSPAFAAPAFGAARGAGAL